MKRVYKMILLIVCIFSFSVNAFAEMHIDYNDQGSAIKYASIYTTEVDGQSWTVVFEKEAGQLSSLLSISTLYIPGQPGHDWVGRGYDIVYNNNQASSSAGIPSEDTTVVDGNLIATIHGFGHKIFRNADKYQINLELADKVLGRYILSIELPEDISDEWKTVANFNFAK